MSRRITLVVIGMFLLVTAVASTKVQDSRATLPKGDWHLMVGVARQATPVDVSGVTTEPQKGFTVTSVKLQNNTNLSAVAVKLHWSLSKSDDPSKVLVEGNTPLIEVSVAPGETAILRYPGISFATAHRPLLTNGELNGSFRMEVRTSEVKYADLSGRRLTDSQALDQIAVNFLPSNPEACSDEGCQYSSTTHKYGCILNTGSKCKPSSDGQSCTESRCGALSD